MQESQANPEDNMAPAEVASHVQRRVRRIAEQAFWDSVQATLAESGSGVSQQQVTGQLAGLLAHMGQDLMAVLPEQATAARQQLAAELDQGKLQEALNAHQVIHHHHHHHSALVCVEFVMSVTVPCICKYARSITVLP